MINVDEEKTRSFNIFIAGLTKELGRQPTKEELITNFKKVLNESKSKMEEIKNHILNINIIKKQFCTDKGDPYLKTIEFLKMCLSAFLKSKGKIELFDKGSSNLLIRNLLVLTEQSHVFYLPNKKLKLLLLNTINNISYRNLPFNHIFINCHLNLNNCVIYGILLTDCHSDNNNILGENIDDINKLNISIFLIGHDHNDGSDFYKDFFIEEKGKFINDHSLRVNNSDGTEYSLEDLEGIDDKISLFVCNFLDFLNNPEVNIIEVERTKEQNEKRIKKGKTPLPPICHIKINGKLKLYFDALDSGADFKYSHKFDVRGHFRILRSDKWKYKQGMKIWIPPYIKGDGIYIKKIYEVGK